jgi:hypothetical protein
MRLSFLVLAGAAIATWLLAVPQSRPTQVELGSSDGPQRLVRLPWNDPLDQGVKAEDPLETFAPAGIPLERSPLLTSAPVADSSSNGWNAASARTAARASSPSPTNGPKGHKTQAVPRRQRVSRETVFQGLFKWRDSVARCIYDRYLAGAGAVIKDCY